MSNAEAWIDIAAEDEVPDGDVTGRYVNGREIALYLLDGEVYATDATCTHGQASLCGGFVEADGSIECPLHQGRFDIRSGKALCEPLDSDLAVHAVKREGGRVWIRLTPS
jgi:naphthalene 1,2-dioxygenase system ferredoxin subunit